MTSILITGCNRGLGLGMVKYLVNSLNKNPQHLFVTCRNVEQATELRQIADQHKNVHILEIDVKNFDKYDEVFKKVEDIVKDNGLNILFNNAGVAPRSTRLPFVKPDELIDNYMVNTVAPIMMTKTFLPLLKIAAKAKTSATSEITKPMIINMSSILGSIEMNVQGGIYNYRVSKAGLNAATKSMSIDLKDNNILCFSMHPGWVRTDMGGSKAPMDIENSCKQIINTIFTLNDSHNGKFIQYNGELLPW